MMQLGAVEHYPTQAAVRMLEFYREHFPAELPHLVARLEAAAGGNGLGQDDGNGDDASWWSRGLDAISNIGSAAAQAWAGYKMKEYGAEQDRELAEQQYQTELERARQQAELAAVQTQELQARAAYEQQVAEIEAAQQSARLQTYLPWILGGGALLAIWAFMRG